MMMLSAAAVKRRKQHLQQNSALIGSSSQSPSAAGLLPYPPSVASLRSKVSAAAAGDDVTKAQVPASVSDNAMYANGHLTTGTLDRHKVSLSLSLSLSLSILVHNLGTLNHQSSFIYHQSLPPLKRLCFHRHLFVCLFVC